MGIGFFFNALNATITMSLKFKEEFGISYNLQDLIVDDSLVALELLADPKLCGKFHKYELTRVVHVA
jgi:hypothetical protein